MVGKINGLFGINGWVKIFSYTDPRKNILSYKPWCIKVQNSWQNLIINTGKEQGKTIIAQIENINDRDSAREYIGTKIYIKKSQLPILKTDQYYWQDLIGLEVINQQNISLGKVSHLVDTGANDVLIVQGEKEHWLPYVEPFLIKVDLNNKQILVNWDEDF